jgi:hypothetical protein
MPRYNFAITLDGQANGVLTFSPAHLVARRQQCREGGLRACHAFAHRRIGRTGAHSEAKLVCRL